MFHLPIWLARVVLATKLREVQELLAICDIFPPQIIKLSFIDQFHVFKRQLHEFWLDKNLIYFYVFIKDFKNKKTI